MLLDKEIFKQQSNFLNNENKKNVYPMLTFASLMLAESQSSFYGAFAAVNSAY